MKESVYDRFPKKRSAAGAIILNERGEILVVNPTYKDHWEFPGGVIEENESPREACLREVKEEVGLDVARADFVGMDYTSPQESKTESFQFIFSCGIISDVDVKRIKLQGSELSEYRFVNSKEAQVLLGPVRGNRLRQMLRALDGGESVYLEDGKVVTNPV